jgi:hypothetical protein
LLLAIEGVTGVTPGAYHQESEANFLHGILHDACSPHLFSPQIYILPGSQRPLPQPQSIDADRQETGLMFPSRCRFFHSVPRMGDLTCHE